LRVLSKRAREKLGAALNHLRYAQSDLAYAYLYEEFKGDIKTLDDICGRVVERMKRPVRY